MHRKFYYFLAVISVRLANTPAPPWTPIAQIAGLARTRIAGLAAPSAQTAAPAHLAPGKWQTAPFVFLVSTAEAERANARGVAKEQPSRCLDNHPVLLARRANLAMPRLIKT